MVVRIRRRLLAATFVFATIFYFTFPRLRNSLLQVAPVVPTQPNYHQPQSPLYDGEGNILRGITVFPSQELSKHLVIARMAGEDVGWVSHLPEWLNMTAKIYDAEADHGELTIPLNKGHEAMTYLTYIINNYFKLPDIVVFVHSHATAWHDNDLHLATTPLMLRELNYGRVMKRGYMNLRCHWKPGCPAWINSDEKMSDDDETAANHLATAFQEIYSTGTNPIEVPRVLGGVCCAQFAVSAETIRGNTLNEYKKWRQWLIDTPLPDRISGRVMEYLWHYMFSSRDQRTPVVCPKEHVCYCDGYGICFGSEKKFKEHVELRELVQSKERSLSLAEDGFNWDPYEDQKFREEGMQRLRDEIRDRKIQIKNDAAAARRRGVDPEARKAEVGISEFSG